MRSVPDRHHISDKVLQLLEPLSPGPRGLWAGIAKNNRQLYNWRLLDIQRRGSLAWFSWKVWGMEPYPPSILLGGEIRVVNDRGQSDQSWPTCGGCGQRESEDESDQRGLNTKLHLAVDQKGRPIRAIIRTCTTADCCQAESLRPGIQTQYLLADRGYDSQAILQTAHQAEMQPGIAPKKGRKYQRNDNQDWYQMRPRVENAFWHLKRWRGIATG